MLIGAGVAVLGFLVTFSPEGLCFLYRNQLESALAEIYHPDLATRCIDFSKILPIEAEITVILFGSLLFILGLWAVATAVWPKIWAIVIYIVAITIYVVALLVVLIIYFIAADEALDYVIISTTTKIFREYFDFFFSLLSECHRLCKGQTQRNLSRILHRR